MKHLLFIVSSLIFLFSCSSDSNKSKPLSIDTTEKKPPYPGAWMTKEYKDIDTLINIKLFDLNFFNTSLSIPSKIKTLRKALETALPEFSDRYLETECWKIDNVTRGPYEDSLIKAPYCRLNEFYFIDLDMDGDLDIVYSSLMDQYLQGDTNYMLLFQNSNGVYKSYDITGYLYEADFSKIKENRILLNTVSRPCCDYNNYNFFSTVFDTKAWKFETKHILEIKAAKVNEAL